MATVDLRNKNENYRVKEGDFIVGAASLDTEVKVGDSLQLAPLKKDTLLQASGFAALTGVPSTFTGSLHIDVKIEGQTNSLVLDKDNKVVGFTLTPALVDAFGHSIIVDVTSDDLSVKVGELKVVVGYINLSDINGDFIPYN